MAADPLELIHAWLDGELDQQAAQELAAWLRADRENLKTFVRETHFHRQLRDLLVGHRSEKAVVDSLLAQHEPARSSQSSSPRKPQRAPILGFLGKLLHEGNEAPLATALSWMVMLFLCSGVVMVLFFCAMLVFQGVGVNVHVNAPQVAQPDVQKNRDAPESNPATARSVPPTRPAQLASTVTVARFVHASDASWAVGSHSPHLGDGLEAGRTLELVSGLAEFTFQNSVRTVLQGPATMEIVSSSSLALQQGKLTVQIDDPNARGFEVQAPGMKYTDLGTEFGVSVARDGTQEMLVFRGKVRAEATGNAGARPSPDVWQQGGFAPASGPQPIILTANEAMHVAGPERFNRIKANGSQFVRPGQMARILSASSPDFLQWRVFSKELSKRGDLIAYYDFEPDESDRTVLRNRAATGSRFDGRLVGSPEWTSGRLLAKQALKFTRPGSGVRVNFPDKYAHLSMIASIYIDHIPSDNLQMLLGSDSWRGRPFGMHWQFSDTIAGFGVSDPRGCDVFVKPPPSKGLMGHWVTFALTCDCDAHEARTYINDELTFRKDFAFAPLEIGSATIGGFNPEDPDIDHPDRTLQGRMDELLIFNAALSSDDIFRINKGLRISE